MNAETVKYLERFPPVAQIVEFAALEQDVVATLPQYWIDIFSVPEFEARKAILLNEWARYPYQLESTTKFLKDNLFDLDLISRDGEISMLYSIKNLAGKPVYYNGLNPKSRVLTPKLQAVWDLLPEAVTTLYENLHNGWFHYSSHATGYSSTQDMIFLADLEWGILDEIDEEALPFKLEDCVSLFQNGGGGYVCFNLKEKDKKKGFIWWKGEAPELDEELCPLIDEWTVIGLEA
ncbi:hypothetical protein SNE26_15725 [Mucilaginibacter sp. cycad4]|uniref:hypothetical protein n=1 Tax=Mucilaginibacter sp. cycad4 TaxID=3342096 RepID=UPI002AAA9EC1|nr:hypothetical protein [Mucilaginibacter gossypii]WPU97475.1 hypothetical protein SNE26_15725 [Mucilaginibacter gossypii]